VLRASSSIESALTVWGWSDA